MMISIIVPVYNVEKYLRRCIDSLRSQTYKDLEIILVDDGSIDGSGNICDEYVTIDNRIKVIHKRNGGLSSARNAGLNIAKGKYIGFLDSDDWARSEMYEFLLNKILSFDCDFAQCGVVLFNDGQDKNEYVVEPKIDEKTIFLNGLEAYKQLYGLQLNEGINFITWNKLYKRELFQNLRFSEGKNNEDIIMTSKLLTLSNIIVVNDTPMVYYMQRTDSIMGKQKKSKIKMLASHCNAYFDVYDYYKNIGVESSGVVNFIILCSISLIKIAILNKDNRKDINTIFADIYNRELQSEKRIPLRDRIVFLGLRLLGRCLL